MKSIRIKATAPWHRNISVMFVHLFMNYSSDLWKHGRNVCYWSTFVWESKTTFQHLRQSINQKGFLFIFKGGEKWTLQVSSKEKTALVTKWETIINIIKIMAIIFTRLCLLSGVILKGCSVRIYYNINMRSFHILFDNIVIG